MKKKLITARNLLFLMVSFVLICTTSGNFVVVAERNAAERNTEGRSAAERNAERTEISVEEESVENSEISTESVTLSGAELQRTVREALNRWKMVSDTQAEGAAREFLVLYHALEEDREIPPRLRKNLTRSVRTKLDALSRQIMKNVDAEKSADVKKSEKPKKDAERPQTVRHDEKRVEMGQVGGMNGADGINNGMNADAQNVATQESGEELVDVIQTTIHPDSWEQNGGNGTIRYWNQGNHLIIRQTDENHEEIQNLLNQLRRAGS
ncbi:MAG: hypothetical protein Q4C70_14575 [Planctomycetia bacterium]|nr:hypothetical protein [Planctomycetia bacterium]